MYVTQKKNIIDTEREAAILQPHFFLRQISSGSLKSEVFVVVVLPQPRKQVCLLFHANLVWVIITFIISLEEIHSQKHQLSLSRNRSCSNCKSITPQPCKWMTYAITVCQHAKILTTPTTKPIKLSQIHNAHLLAFYSKMPLQRKTNIIKFEQCILYKYFKSVEISLLYVCVHKQFEWMVKMWCFCFSRITKWSQY